MLASLDVLIGVVVILLGMSLLVTMIGQGVSTALALRARNLEWGLSMLVQELHLEKFPRACNTARLFSRDLNPDVRNAMKEVLAHRLVSDSKFPLQWWRFASTIRFDEFLKMIHLLGAPPSGAALTTQDQTALQWLRENNRITEPWFQTVMDRVSQRFTMHMRIYSVVVAAVVVLVLGMDTLYIAETLRNDAALRAGLVAAADQLAQAEALDPNAKTRLQNHIKTVASNLPEDRSLAALVMRQDYSVPRVPGMLLSILLLSLGAPFWFSMLKNLTSLRSVVARKEDKEQQGVTAAIVPDVGDRIQVRSF